MPLSYGGHVGAVWPLKHEPCESVQFSVFFKKNGLLGVDSWLSNLSGGLLVAFSQHRLNG